MIKRDDFLELKYVVNITNTTTKTTVKDIDRITIAEFREKGLVLKLPKNSCTMGHMLLVQIHPRTNEKQTPPKNPAEHKNFEKARQANAIEVTAKVALVETTDDDFLLVGLEFYQFNESKWQSFVKTFTQRQDKISNLVNQVKN